MLISAQKRFIFVANVKTASTSIEAALTRYADVHLDRTETGKHISISDIDVQFAGLFKFLPRQRYKVISVMREPLDWLMSLYKSHKAVCFKGTALSTENLSFAEFLRAWVRDNRDQCLPQTHRLVTHDSFAADFIMDYGHLQRDFETVCRLIDVPRRPLPKLNMSEGDELEGPVCGSDIDSIYDDYRQDIAILRDYSRRLLSAQDRNEAFELCQERFERKAPRYYRLAWPMPSP